MLYGYACVSCLDQDLSIQLDALAAVGCTVVSVRAMKAGGMGATEIAKALKVGRGSVYRALEGP